MKPAAPRSSLRSRLTRLIDRQLPHALVSPDNPVFQYELRKHIKHRSSTQDLKRYGMMVLGSLYVATLFCCTCASSLSNNSRGVDLALSNILSGGSLVLPLILLISVGATLGADLYYLLATGESISRHIISGQWDILRLTALPEQEILMAKYAIVQINAWQLVTVDVAMRAVGATLVAASIFIGALYNNSNYHIQLSPYDVLLLLIYAIFALTYILEPLWRMRAFIALGMAISAQVHNPTFAALAGFGSWAAVRLLQLILLSLVGCGLISLLTSISLTTSRGGSYFLEWLVYFLGSCVVAWVVYVFYKLLQIVCLRRALRFAFRSQ